MGKAERMKTKGWFQGLGRDGDRSLEQQMIGLERVVEAVPGKTVIDAGCAEGLITMVLSKAGATRCVGLEIVPGFVAVATTLADEQDLDCEFVEANLNNFDVTQLKPADIVLMLAVLHKVKQPSQVCADLAALAKEMCVIRLPPSGLVIRDARSGNVPHDIGEVMTRSGFVLDAVVDTTLGEWLGYFRRAGSVETTATKTAASETNPAESATETAANATLFIDSETRTPESEPKLDETQAKPDVVDGVAIGGETAESTASGTVIKATRVARKTAAATKALGTVDEAKE